MACFLPECVRKTVTQVKTTDAKIPLGIQMYVVLLSCEIAAIPEVIDLYSISSSFSIVDVVDELNIHLTRIIKKIVSQGGDIIYLEDDLLQCIWRVVDDVNAVCATALKTAISIQHDSAVTRTKIRCDLKNRIAITVGDLNILFVGTARVYYTAVGSIQKEMKTALRSYDRESVIVTESFWINIANKEKYEAQEVKENFVAVHSTTERVTEMDEDAEEEEYQRLETLEAPIVEELHKYLQIFHKSAKTSQQLEIMTSMSQVVYVAVRTIDLDLSSLELLNKATDVVYNIVEEFEGILGKIVSLATPTFCITFGLPGFKHKDDAVRGVLCAQRILKSLEDLKIKTVIGISSGMLFCGVLGPRLRQEFCVLGMTVHIAQNIVNQMSSYQLVCGINTFFRTCRMLGEIFSPVRRRLKGVKSSNLFFKISAEEVKKLLSQAKCIGRKKEKEMLGSALKELKEGIRDLDKNLLPLININGMLGTGKSSMLSWCMNEGRNLGYRLVARVDNSMFEAPNDNAWAIVKQVLSSQLVDNETKIMEILGPDATKYPLQQLNRRLNLSFAQPPSIIKGDSPREMMVELVQKSAGDDPILIGLDNAEHTGTESWLFLQCLLYRRCACVVASFTEEFTTNVPFVRQLIHQQYLGIHLDPILGTELASLACHLLSVDAIHKGFLDFLEEQSGGNALHLREILMLPPLQKHFCLVPYISVTESTLQANFVPADEEAQVNAYTARVCDILDPEGLRSIKIPKQLLDVFKDRSTALNPEEQMLMRKCSLLGDTFGLSILEAVCPEFTFAEVEEILNRTKRLMNLYKTQSQPDHIEISISRLRSKLKLRYGQVNDALRTLKHAFLSMNVVFPNDLQKKKKPKLMKGILGEEEWKCLSLGSLILLTLREYTEAYSVADYNLNCLLERNAAICPIIEAKVFCLKALTRGPPKKNREKTLRKLMNEIKQMCFKRLSEKPDLNVKELRTVIRSLRSLVLGLFEIAELEAGEDLARKLFQLLKTINNVKQLARVCFWRANIFFYAGDYKKCLEMLSELQDAHEQSGDTISQVIYYTMLVKVVREPETNIGENEIAMCHEYANQGAIVSSYHPKHNERIFCLSAAIALWCEENELEDKVSQWYDQAMKFKMDVDINSYLTVLGSIYLVRIEICKMKHKSFVFTEEEITGHKQEKQKSIEILQRQAKDYVPVLEKEAKHLEKYLHNAFKGCNILKSSEKMRRTSR